MSVYFLSLNPETKTCKGTASKNLMEQIHYMRGSRKFHQGGHKLFFDTPTRKDPSPHAVFKYLTNEIFNAVLSIKNMFFIRNGCILNWHQNMGILSAQVCHTFS